MTVRNMWKPRERYYHADDLTTSYSYLYLSSIGESGVQLQATEKCIHDHLFKPNERKFAEKGNDAKNSWLLMYFQFIS